MAAALYFDGEDVLPATHAEQPKPEEAAPAPAPPNPALPVLGPTPVVATAICVDAVAIHVTTDAAMSPADSRTWQRREQTTRAGGGRAMKRARGRAACVYNGNVCLLKGSHL